jgi:hypothetical protein
LRPFKLKALSLMRIFNLQKYIINYIKNPYKYKSKKLSKNILKIDKWYNQSELLSNIFLIFHTYEIILIKMPKHTFILINFSIVSFLSLKRIIKVIMSLCLIWATTYCIVSIVFTSFYQINQIPIKSLGFIFNLGILFILND